jgi:hypothetical protein
MLASPLFFTQLSIRGIFYILSDHSFIQRLFTFNIMKKELFRTVNFWMTSVKTGVRMGVGMKEKFTYGQNICNLNFANGG